MWKKDAICHSLTKTTNEVILKKHQNISNKIFITPKKLKASINKATQKWPIFIHIWFFGFDKLLYIYV